MTAFDRIELERALRTEGNVGALHHSVIHNVRIRAGIAEIYGREDWVQLETARNAVSGSQTVETPRMVTASLGRSSSLVAAEWRLGLESNAPRAACLCIVKAGRIVREWQVTDQAGHLSTGRQQRAPGRFGIPWEYGEMRAGLGQTAPGDSAAGIAPAGIATHPAVLYWHRLWNRREGDTQGLLAGFAEPVMFCERLVAPPSGDVVALQWRLVERHVADAWGVPASGLRLEMPGLSFIRLDGARIVDREDHFDRSVLAEQVSLRTAIGA